MPQRTPAAKPNRPRDPNAPPKPARPRDELGRPLSRDAENTLQLENYDSLPLEENHRLGIEHLNAGHYFPAHEAWEAAWKQSKATSEAEFFGEAFFAETFPFLDFPDCFVGSPPIPASKRLTSACCCRLRASSWRVTRFSSERRVLSTA